MSTTDAEYKLADASACICKCVHIVHVYVHIRKRMHLCPAMCRRVREGDHGNILVCTSLLRCLCIQSIPNYSPQRTAGGELREGRGEELTVTLVPRTSSTSWNLTCVRCQHQATAMKAYNSASAISWPWRWTLVSFCHFWKTGRLIRSRV